MQNSAEMEALLDLYRERKPKRVLEIGTSFGGTLYHWLQNAEPGTLVVSVDSHVDGINNQGLYQEWVPPGVKLCVIGGDSRAPETVEMVRGLGPYGWCFIDGDHSYEGVRDDWLHYGPMMEGRGVLCLHDILAEHVGVPRLWRAISGRYPRTREIVGPHEPGSPEWGLEPDTPWGGIGLVYL